MVNVYCVEFLQFLQPHCWRGHGNVPLHVGSRPLVTSCYKEGPTVGSLMLHIGSQPFVTSCYIKGPAIGNLMLHIGSDHC